MVRFNFRSNMPEAEHCSSKIVDFTKKYMVEIVENEDRCRNLDISEV